MEIGGDRYRTVGGVHRIPIDGASGILVLAGLEAVDNRLDGGGGVVVHCGAGWGRAGLVGALVLVAYGATVTEALDRVRAARPAAGPQSDEQDQQLIRLAPVVNEPTRRR